MPSTAPSKPPKRGICEHGLGDQVEVTMEIVIKDHKAKRRTTTYTYYCREHERHGTFTVQTAL